MEDTRTWLTTPVGSVPVDDRDAGEWWVRGPSVPTEPRPRSRYRGAVVMALVLLAVVGLTWVLTPAVLDVQDPTFGDAGERLDADDFDPTFDRPTSN